MFILIEAREGRKKNYDVKPHNTHSIKHKVKVVSGQIPLPSYRSSTPVIGRLTCCVDDSGALKVSLVGDEDDGAMGDVAK